MGAFLPVLPSLLKQEAFSIIKYTASYSCIKCAVDQEIFGVGI
jgi:hypothetical protein